MSDLLTIRDKVTRYTTRVFSDVQIDEDGDLAVPLGSTRIYVRVTETTDPEVVAYRNEHNLYKFIVHSYAVVLYGVEPSEEFFKWIAVEGSNYWLGNFKAVKQQDKDVYNLIFEASIVADELDETELRSVLWAIASTADGDDEELQQKFGGKRARE
ncbi:MAG: T3SS (YopN, CesT) and YbjN peptide-binding chaperone 1 [Candidatus Nanopelagicales bacterium]